MEDKTASVSLGGIRRLALGLWLCAALSASCVGDIGGGGEGSSDSPSGPESTEAAEVSSSALRRLSVHELENTLQSVAGLVPEAIERVPPDGLEHSFDRVVNAQTMSPAHLEAFSAIATEVATSLMGGDRLGELVSACPAESIPSLVKPVTKTIDGKALSLGPEWAVGTSNNYGTTTYAPDPEAMYAHLFAAPGDYTLSVQLNINGPVDTLDVLLDSQVVATQQNLDGPQSITATLSIAEAGSHVIQLALKTDPDDSSLMVVYQSLTIEGPLGSGPEPSADAVHACAASIVDELAPKAYRRPLDEPERQRLIALYEGLAETYGSADALHSLLEAIFSSPYFLFLVELGEPVAGSEGLYRLGPWELAARLSYAICEQPPDEELRKAAADGALETSEQIAAQATRLFAQPCARSTVRRFFEYWLWLNRLPSMNKSAEMFPEYTAAVQDGMMSESKRFIDELVWNEQASITSFFDAPYAWPDPNTAFLYGLSSSDGGKANLPEERAGILTSSPVLAVTGTFDGTSPVMRGVYVLEQILCSGTPPPPTNVDIAPPPPDPNLTTRERWAEHSADPTCKSCHQLIDPIGFAFEEFDGLGRHRTEENGHPVDASGGVPSMGVEDGSLVGGAALGRVVAQSEELRACAARQWLRFSFGRMETESDAETLASLSTAFDETSIREALLSIVTSEAFVHRQEKPE